jgi:hypothetical protein
MKECSVYVRLEHSLLISVADSIEWFKMCIEIFEQALVFSIPSLTYHISCQVTLISANLQNQH